MWLTPSSTQDCGRCRPSAPYAASAFITLRNLSSTVSLAFGLQKPRNTSTVSPACVTVTQSGGRSGRVTLILPLLRFNFHSFPGSFRRNCRFLLRFVALFLGDGPLQRRLHGATDVVALGAVYVCRLRHARFYLWVKVVTGFRRPSAFMLSASSRTSCVAASQHPGRTMISSIAIFIPASSLYNDVAGRSFPVGRTIPPLPYGENRGSKRNCFLQAKKYFFERASD